MTSVASALIDETAACRPRITGRMVWGKEAPSAPPWAVALEAKPRQTIDMHMARILAEVVIQISEGLQFVLNAYIAHVLHRLETSRSRDEALVEPHNHRCRSGKITTSHCYRGENEKSRRSIAALATCRSTWRVVGGNKVQSSSPCSK